MKLVLKGRALNAVKLEPQPRACACVVQLCRALKTTPFTAFSSVDDQKLNLGE